MSLEEEREAEVLAAIFAALSNKRRVIILDCLVDGEKSVGELANCERLAPSTQPNTSQHLSILRNAGLVKERRDGNRVFYRLASPHVRDLVRSSVRLVGDRRRGAS